MWTYHEDELKNLQPIALPSSENEKENESDSQKEPVLPDKPDIAAEKPARPTHPRRIRKKYSEWYLAGIYLCGLLCGSVCYSFLSKPLLRYVSLFTQRNLDLYHAADSTILFSTRFLSFFVQLTVLLLLGFCTFGKWVIPLDFYVKGVGTGCFWIECVQAMGLTQGLLFRILILWLPELFIMLLMLQLGCYALETSDMLWRACKGDVNESLKAQSKRFVRSYLINCLLALIPCVLSAFSVRVFGVFFGF